MRSVTDVSVRARSPHSFTMFTTGNKIKNRGVNSGGSRGVNSGDSSGVYGGVNSGVSSPLTFDFIWSKGGSVRGDVPPPPLLALASFTSNRLSIAGCVLAAGWLLVGCWLVSG